MTSLYPQLSTQTPGALLSRAREEAGLTLADVAARSRVPVSALSAIDDDEYDRLPAVTYARGFLRLYAREVGLDPDAVVKAYETFHVQGEAPSEASYTPYVTNARRTVGAQRNRGTPAFGLAVGAVVMAIVVALLWNPADGVDHVPMGSDFSAGALEMPQEKP